MTTWDEQEAAADRREAIENEAGERAAKYFASPEALVKAIDEATLEEEDLLLEARALCAMWLSNQASIQVRARILEAEAIEVLRKFTEAVFSRLCAEEKRKIERGE